ncbi:MAG: hypothetical protein R3258_05895 [Acidimicrobiia bacterium]|nr:hypothetical protein [Acidimicrobiia bacterium]
MRAEASARGHDRPPSQIAAGHADASVRPTARTRPVVPVAAIEKDGYPPSDPYVRRFWVAAIGPAAVAELLKLMRAAAKGEEVPLPRSLPVLLKLGLAHVENGSLVVGTRIPAVPAEMRWRFPPSLAAEHATMVASNG